MLFRQDVLDAQVMGLVEKQRAEARLEDLAALDYKPADVEATVDVILARLGDSIEWPLRGAWRSGSSL